MLEGLFSVQGGRSNEPHPGDMDRVVAIPVGQSGKLLLEIKGA